MQRGFVQSNTETLQVIQRCRNRSIKIRRGTKNVMWNVVCELTVTVEDIKRNVEKTKFIKEIKRILWTGKVNRNRIDAKRRCETILRL